MDRRIAQFAAVLAVSGFLASPAIAVPAYPVAIGAGVGADVEQASFWGLPFPYGYADLGHRCVRHIRVHTRHGIRWRRVWLCR